MIASRKDTPKQLHAYMGAGLLNLLACFINLSICAKQIIEAGHANIWNILGAIISLSIALAYFFYIKKETKVILWNKLSNIDLKQKDHTV